MERLKKHPLFALLLLLGAAAAGWEAWQIIATRERVRGLAVALEQKRMERDWLVRQSPALSEENTLAIAADLAAAEAKLAELRTVLAGARVGQTEAPARPLEAYFALAGYMGRMRALAARQQVVLKAEERFGFATYANEGPEPELLAAVHRQRTVLQHLLETLLEARPKALIASQRERPLTESQRAARRRAPGTVPADDEPAAGQQADFFEPAGRLRLQAPGLAEGELYRLEFTGQTQVLRAFLNGLATSPLPLIVRAVEVEPAETEPVEPDAALPEAIVPVVSRNLCKFAVVVQCVDAPPASLESSP